MSDDAIAGAIKTIEKCRDIHAWWVRWLTANPEESQQLQPIVETAGGVLHHELAEGGRL